MKFDLLSLNLLLVVCGASVTMLVFLLSKIIWPLLPPPPSRRGRPKKTDPPKRPRRVLQHMEFALLVASTFFGSVVLMLGVSYATDSPLPSGFAFMTLPFVVSFCLLIIVIAVHKKYILAAAVCCLISLVFTLLLVNNYYRFYPTLGEVFNQNGALALNASQQRVEVRYLSAGSKNSSDKQSLEEDVLKIPTEPTAGKVYSLDIPGSVSHFKARTAFVYLPAVYSTDPNIALPVIILMPGFPGLPENWLASGLEATMDAFAKEHNGITPIVFVVDDTGGLTNDTECVDSPRGNAETYLSVDVPNYIKSHFDVETDSSHWAIGGLSLGGTCSIMLALRHPNVYHYFIDLGGEIGPEIGSQQQTIDTLFGGSESAWQMHQPAYLLSTRSYKGLGMGGFFGVGKQDTLDVTQAAAQLSSASQKAGIETVYDTINGQHTFNVWQQTFKLSLPWVSNRLGATECNANCP